MDAIERKELLHLRIEQANEEMQIVLAKMVEALFQTYQPEVIQEEKEWTDEEIMAIPPPPSMRKPRKRPSNPCQ
jgi:lipoate-protein ligase A